MKKRVTRADVQGARTKDKFGFSWQIIPKVLGEMMSHPTKGKAVTEAMLAMVKLDIAALARAYDSAQS